MTNVSKPFFELSSGSQNSEKRGSTGQFFCVNFFRSSRKPFWPYGGLLVNGYPFVYPENVFCYLFGCRDARALDAFYAIKNGILASFSSLAHESFCISKNRSDIRCSLGITIVKCAFWSWGVTHLGFACAS